MQPQIMADQLHSHIFLVTIRHASLVLPGSCRVRLLGAQIEKPIRENRNGGNGRVSSALLRPEYPTHERNDNHA